MERKADWPRGDTPSRQNQLPSRDPALHKGEKENRDAQMIHVCSPRWRPEVHERILVNQSHTLEATRNETQNNQNKAWGSVGAILSAYVATPVAKISSLVGDVNPSSYWDMTSLRLTLGNQ